LRPNHLHSLAISSVFFVLAGWFFFGPAAARPTVPPSVPVTAADIDPSPPRQVIGVPPSVVIGGYDQTCTACHKLFDSRPETLEKPLQHGHIELDHGLNARCFNCHDLENRDLFRLHGTATATFDRVEELCAKCHGPTFRDWERGMHGRSTGSWDTNSPERGRLVCTQCHDPHSPARSAIAPLPGPNTLRMGDQSHNSHHLDPDERSPLLRRTGAED